RTPGGAIRSLPLQVRIARGSPRVSFIGSSFPATAAGQQGLRPIAAAAQQRSGRSYKPLAHPVGVELPGIARQICLLDVRSASAKQLEPILDQLQIERISLAQQL